MSAIQGHKDLLGILNRVVAATGIEKRTELQNSILSISEVLFPGDTIFDETTKSYKFSKAAKEAPGQFYRQKLDTKVSVVAITEEALSINIDYGSGGDTDAKRKTFKEDFDDFVDVLVNKGIIPKNRHVKNIDALRIKLEGVPDPASGLKKDIIKPYSISSGSLLVLEPLTIVASSFTTIRNIITAASKKVKKTNQYFGITNTVVAWSQLLKRQERGTVSTPLDFCNRSTWVNNIRSRLPKGFRLPQILVKSGGNYYISDSFAKLAGSVNLSSPPLVSESELPNYETLSQASIPSSGGLVYEASGKTLAGAWIQARSVLDIGHMFIPEEITFSTPLSYKLEEIAKSNIFSKDIRDAAKNAISTLAGAHATSAIGSASRIFTETTSGVQKLVPPKDTFEVARVILEYQNKGIKASGELADNNVLNLTLHHLGLNNVLATKYEAPAYEAVTRRIFSELATKIAASSNELISISGSNTLLEDIAQSVSNILSGKSGQVPGHSALETTLAIFGKGIKKRSGTVKSNTTTPASKPAVKRTKGSRPSKVTQTSKVSFATEPPKPQIISNLQQLLNANLAQKIRENMGGGNSKRVLNNRTGRFADSVKVERMSESRAGMITAFYSYMKNPYATFSEGGRQQYPKTRDPKLLISKSIRELAGTAVTNRMRAVLA